MKNLSKIILLLIITITLTLFALNCGGSGGGGGDDSEQNGFDESTTGDTADETGDTEDGEEQGEEEVTDGSSDSSDYDGDTTGEYEGDSTSDTEYETDTTFDDDTTSEEEAADEEEKSGENLLEQFTYSIIATFDPDYTYYGSEGFEIPWFTWTPELCMCWQAVLEATELTVERPRKLDKKISYYEIPPELIFLEPIEEEDDIEIIQIPPELLVLMPADEEGGPPEIDMVETEDPEEVYLMVYFEAPVYPRSIAFYQGGEPGLALKIEAEDQEGNYINLWEGVDDSTACPGVFSVTFDEGVTVLTDTIRVTPDLEKAAGIMGLDAVKLVGVPEAPVSDPVSYPENPPVCQWVSTAAASSSMNETGPGSPDQIFGYPDFELAEDASISSWQPSDDITGMVTGMVTVDLHYYIPVFPTALVAYEVVDYGFITRVEARNDQDQYVELWSGTDETANYDELEMLRFIGTFATKDIRLTIDTSLVSGQLGLDAVLLIGLPEEPIPMPYYTIIPYL